LATIHNQHITTAYTHSQTYVKTPSNAQLLDTKKHLVSDQVGFTLIELLMVVVLLSIISTIAVFNYQDVQESSRVDVAKYELSVLRKALIQFRRDTGELPCRVYREGTYNPQNTDFNVTGALDLSDLPTSPTVADYKSWCQNELLAGGTQVDSGLTMLTTFPYDELLDSDLYFNSDTKRGWNGPYINQQGLTDPWGRPYVILDSELDFKSSYRCLVDGIDYDKAGDLYDCIQADDTGFPPNYTLKANIARIVSFGPDQISQSPVANSSNDDEICTANGDDIVVCLLQ
jgi:prepilin-type N-terminal cleavage/methylation domain-containing protein